MLQARKGLWLGKRSFQKIGAETTSTQQPCTYCGDLHKAWRHGLWLAGNTAVPHEQVAANGLCYKPPCLSTAYQPGRILMPPLFGRAGKSLHSHPLAQWLQRTDVQEMFTELHEMENWLLTTLSLILRWDLPFEFLEVHVHLSHAHCLTLETFVNCQSPCVLTLLWAPKSLTALSFFMHLYKACKIPEDKENVFLIFASFTIYFFNM